MKKTIFISCIIMVCLHSGVSGQEHEYLINDIHIIDVNNGKVRKADVLIKNGKIAKIRRKLRAPATIRQLNGTGKWLMPGLVDAHIHLFQSGGLYTRPDAFNLTTYRSYETERQWLRDNASDILKRYLRCGITTVIDVGGPLYNFEIRKQFKDNRLYPNLFLTGPLVSTYQPEAFKIDDPPIVKVNSPEKAINLVQQQLPYRPDFIKIWYIVTREQSPESNYAIVEATINESHKHGLKVAVHATALSTAKLAIKAGADILVHSVRETIDEEFIQLVLKNDVVYIPTLIVYGNYDKAYAQEINPSAADLLWSSPVPLGSLYDSRHITDSIVTMYKRYYSHPEIKKETQKINRIMRENLERLNAYPVIISTGTDAGNTGTLHGTSYYDEIQQMKKAGLSNLDILRASTVNGAKTLGKDHEFGTVTVGKTADLLILNSNPLNDINHLKDIAFVIKKGHLHHPDSIVTVTPETLVQQQLNAYNARNIDALMAFYSEDAALYEFPGRLTVKGKEHIGTVYGNLFKRAPELHSELLKRIVLGNTIIDHERISGIPDKEPYDAVAIYTIKNDKISRVSFIRKE